MTADDPLVALAYVHDREVAHSWHRSIIDLLGYDLQHAARITRGGWFAVSYGTDGLVAARNSAAAAFLASDADWLFWVDTDMGFAPDTVDRLLAAADPVRRPIVGALCFAQRERDSDGMGGYRTGIVPTIYDWVSGGEQGPTGFLSRTSYPADTLLRCAGTGSACILIHRGVLEAIGDGGWYDRARNPTTGDLLGEDLSLCLRAGARGIPIHVHTGVRTTHLKHHWLGEADHTARLVPSPATQDVAVIVPVLHRTEAATPFMASLRASTGRAQAYAVAHVEDTATADAWRDAGAQVIVGDARTFAEKANAAYAATNQPWMLLVGDDVQFRAGWLDHALAAAGTDHHVVATNDLHNPRVLAGEHATHPLIRRSYVDELGSSWGGPGTLCHPGYRHNYVDDEITTVARQRGVFAAAPGSIVEHLHPAWGTGADDEVYALGRSTLAADHEEYLTRCAEYAS